MHLLHFVLSIKLHVTFKTYEAMTITCTFHVSFNNVNFECFKIAHTLRVCSHSAIFSDSDCDLFFAYNGLQRSWWCCRSRIVWTFPLSPVQSICCNKRNRSRNQKKTAMCERALNKTRSQVRQGHTILTSSSSTLLPRSRHSNLTR